MIRLMPPPPSARCQESRPNIVPSIASSRPTMRSCSPVKYSAALSMSIVTMPARRALASAASRDQRVVADVGAILHAVEMNESDGGVGIALGVPHVVPQRGDAKHAPAAGHDLAVGNRSGGMKHLALVARLIETGDDIAAARVAGIAGGGEDDAERDSPVPLRVDPVERAVDSVLEEIDQVRFEPHHDRLGFRVSQTAVEFERRWIAGGVDHHAGVEESGVRYTVGSHAVD